MISAIGGSIGNLILSSPSGLANVTADSILGNIDVYLWLHQRRD